MTEADWLTSTDPRPMLDFLDDRARPRKLRLFACAWAYDFWKAMPDERCREAVVVAERYADGRATGAELLAAYQAATDAWRENPFVLAGRHGMGVQSRKGTRAARRAAEAARQAADPAWRVSAAARAVWGQKAAIRYALSNYLRDLFGNPFRRVVFRPSWTTPTVTALARGAYESGDFTVLPILADALQDAGCDEPEVLDHCRGCERHVRGCWVVDLVLGKQ
jgi:hypothetical protein